MLPPHARASLFFFFNDTATTEIYTLSLHDALPISSHRPVHLRSRAVHKPCRPRQAAPNSQRDGRSEEHTSELQSQSNLVCRLLLEKKTTVPFSGIGALIEDVYEWAVNLCAHAVLIH